jgi:hypothetical protein
MIDTTQAQQLSETSKIDASSEKGTLSAMRPETEITTQYGGLGDRTSAENSSSQDQLTSAYSFQPSTESDSKNLSTKASSTVEQTSSSHFDSVNATTSAETLNGQNKTPIDEKVSPEVTLNNYSSALASTTASLLDISGESTSTTMSTVAIFLTSTSTTTTTTTTTTV